MQWAPCQQTDQQMDLSMDPLTDLPAIAETTHHTILNQISEAIADTKIMKTAKTDRASTKTTIETEGTSRIHGTTRGMGSRTGMTIIKIETGLTTGDNQTNTNTTETNQIYKPKPNGIDANSKKFHHIRESMSVKWGTLQIQQIVLL